MRKCYPERFKGNCVVGKGCPSWREGGYCDYDGKCWCQGEKEIVIFT